LKEVAASKIWGKIPSVQATFQLEIGNLISLLTFHNYSVHIKRRRRKRRRRRSRRKTNRTCFWQYLFSALVMQQLIPLLLEILTKALFSIPTLLLYCFNVFQFIYFFEAVSLKIIPKLQNI
jgi:hypothetical protein